MGEIDHNFHRIDSLCEASTRTMAICDVHIAEIFASIACDRALIQSTRLALKQSRELLSRISREIQQIEPDVIGD